MSKFVVDSPVVVLDIPEVRRQFDSEVDEMTRMIAALGSDTKGGAGSGNFGHGGREGHEGGSVSHSLSKVSVRFMGDEGEIRSFASEKFGLNLDTDLSPMMSIDLEGSTTGVRVNIDSSGKGLIVQSVSSVPSPEGGTETVCDCVRHFVKDESSGEVIVIHEELSIEGKFQSQKIGDRMYDRQIKLYRQKDYHSIRTYANTSVGKYAWAKRGFQYLTTEIDAEYHTDQFRSWAKEHGVDIPRSVKFSTPQEIAEFQIDGIKIHTDDLSIKSDIRPGEYDLGKAFMLDSKGHGAWNGVFYLK